MAADSRQQKTESRKKVVVNHLVVLAPDEHDVVNNGDARDDQVWQSTTACERFSKSSSHGVGV
jgi:hypothetical protein